MKLDGAHVVVTGGSGGIGEAMATAFADRGARVLVAARSEEKLRDIADRIVGDHLVTDLTDPDEVDRFVPRCLETLGHVDVFVNNAGIETNQSFATVDRARVRELARLNLEAPMLLTRDILPHFLARDSGHIIQTSSIAGAVAFPGLAAYAGSKAGLTNFTESLRLELKRTGIGLTVVSPGIVDTEMWGRVEAEDTPFVDVAIKRFRRLGFLPLLSAGDVADATVQAVEDDRRFVRLPRRYLGFHLLSNSPRRLVEAVLVGARFPHDWQDEETGA